MANKKSPAKKPTSTIAAPSGTLSTADLRAFKAKSAVRKPNQRQSQFGK